MNKINNSNKKCKVHVFYSLGTVILFWVAMTLSLKAFSQKNSFNKSSERNYSSVKISKKLITGGVVRGTNLFYTFKEFNIDLDQHIFFFNPKGIKLIIARVTGGTSRILGELGVIGGEADLFVLNPNGIFFGPKASLNIKGSFFATTADSFLFEDGEFGVLGNSAVLKLSTNAPIGLRFWSHSEGEIKIASGEVGLSVEPGKTLTFVGGDITLNGGYLSAPGGHIELASISGVGRVDVSQRGEAFKFESKDSLSLGSIRLFNQALIDTNGNTRGSIFLQGKNVTISNSASQSNNFSDTESNSEFNSIKIIASDTFKLTEGSYLTSSTIRKARGGNIIIEAKRVFLDGNSFIQTASSFIGSQFATGNAGNVIIDANQMYVSRGGFINASTTGSGNGGNITIGSSEKPLNYINISGESSGLFAIGENTSTGNAGNLNLFARVLQLENNAELKVSNEGAGTGKAGNLTIQDAETIILRNNSSISTNANKASGGNIVISTGVLAALGNSDITAKAVAGPGGRVSITARGIFGTEVRDDFTNESDIIVSSSLGPEFNGIVDLNVPDTNPSQGLFESPTTVFDPNALLAQNPCRRSSESEFTNTGRGGLPPSLSQDLDNNSTQVGLVEPALAISDRQQPKTTEPKTPSLASDSSPLVPAQGWVFNDKGNVVLVAYNSAVEGPQRLQSTPAGCPVR